jgi:hypothetical protein
MSAKPTGLAAFTRGRAAEPGPAQDSPAIVGTVPPPTKPTGGAARKRAQGETVALTVRIPRADWARLHQLAVAEGVSLQALALDGLSRVFAEHGLPPVAS